MFKGSVKVKFKPAEVAAMHQKKLMGSQGVQSYLTGRVIRDTNKFVPYADGTLATSPIRGSNYEGGKIVYNEPYARRLYYGIRFKFSRDKHTSATHHWFEKAKSIYLDAWGNAVAKLLGGAWRRGA